MGKLMKKKKIIEEREGQGRMSCGTKTKRMGVIYVKGKQDKTNTRIRIKTIQIKMVSIHMTTVGKIRK